MLNNVGDLPVMHEISNMFLSLLTDTEFWSFTVLHYLYFYVITQIKMHTYIYIIQKWIIFHILMFIKSYQQE